MTSMLRRLVQSRPEDLDEPFLVVSSWTSRTASLYRCRAAGATTDVVVKVGRDWLVADAFDAFASLVRLDHTMLCGATRVRVPAPLGWDASPPAVCTQHIGGTDLFFLIRDVVHERWATTKWTPEEIAAECGRALGAFHSAARPAAPERSVPAFEIAARPLRIPPQRAEEVARHLTIAPMFGDYGLHQFRLGDDDELYLMDPPSTSATGPALADVASFAFNLRKVIATDSEGRRKLPAEELIDSFYYGYAEVGPTDPRLPLNTWALNVLFAHKARGLAHKRVRSGDVVAAVRHGWDYVRRFARAHVREPFFH